ncbi:phytoene/squalene synthase family protein [Lysobacter korlensis]|uniref:Phytoene/squalene synthase family protein n=1 Tax=Lysobacter korlensis TaxID=553636 RepID=A0ABV6RM26_9GAMM
MTAAPAGDGSADDALSSFYRKWLERWPEWPVVEVFVIPQRRETAIAWAALQQELLDAAWGGRESNPGELKLAWWSEELLGWAQGRRRHPLGRVLQRETAPWDTLALALPTLTRSRERPLDPNDAFASIEPAASAAAGIDSALFEGSATAADTVAATWLAWRVLQHGESAVPLAVLAEVGQGDGAQRWRTELLRRWPSQRGATRLRRLWASLAYSRLESPGGRAPASWRVLWRAWNAARN